MSVYWNGRRLVIPQAASKVEVGSIRGFLGATNIVAVVGESEAGPPYTEGQDAVLSFTDPLEAQARLRSGKALKGIYYIFRPSGSEPGAYLVKFLRVNPATKATLDVMDAANGTTNVFTLKSRDWGTWVNQIKAKLEVVNDGNGDEYVLSAKYEPDSYQESSPNLGRAFTIQYTGSGTACTLAISDTAFATIVDGSPDIQIDLTSPTYDTIEKLFAYLSGLPDYTVLLNSNYQRVGRIPSNQLDNVSGQDIKTNVYQVTAYNGSMVDWANTYSELLVAEFKTEDLPQTFDWTQLAGGTNPAPTYNDWTDAIDMLGLEDVQLIWVSTDEEAVHMALTSHCQAWKNQNERMGFVGAGLGEYNVSTIGQRAMNLNSDVMVFCAPGFKTYDIDTGEEVTLGGMYMAALACGIAAGKDPAVPLTRKYLGNIVALENKYTKSEFEQLIQRGITAVEETQKGYRIVKGVTTVQLNERLWNVNATTPEISLRRTVDAILKSARMSVDETIIGTNARYAQAHLHEVLVDVLEKVKAAGWIWDELTTDPPIPAYDIIKIYRVDDAWYATIGLHLPDPVNFVLITGRIV